MGRLRIGTDSVIAINSASNILAGKKPVVEMRDAAHGSLRAGVNAIAIIHTGSVLLGGAKPTLEAGDSTHGDMRVNIDIVNNINVSSALLGGKRPTIEIGEYLVSTGQYVPAKLEAPIRSGLTHWQIDALGGTKMELTVRGKLDNAIYAVAADGSITIPQAAHGDTVSYIRGVYPADAEGNWYGFWANLTVNGSPATNYYQNHTIMPGGDTVITLNTTLPQGTELQVYYLYETLQTVSRYTYVHSYPCLYKGAGGTYPYEISVQNPGACKFSSAVDSDEMFVMACQEAFMQSGDVRFREIAWTIMDALINYGNMTSDYSYLDEMNYTPWQGDIAWYFTVGDPKPSIQVVYDPFDSMNLVLKIVSTASSYSIVGKIGNFLVDNTNRFQVDFIGENSGAIYLIEICNDPNRSDAVDKRFYYSFRDTSTNKRPLSYPVKDFRSRKNAVFSDMLNTYSGSYKGATAQQTAGVEINPYVESTGNYDITHFMCIKNSWDFTQCYQSPGEVCSPDPNNPNGPPICTPLPPPTYDAYAGVFCTFNSSEVQSQNYPNINFYMQINTPGTYRFIIKDTANIQFYVNKYIAVSGRVVINWSEFNYYSGGTGNELITHPIYQVYFEAKDNPITGTFYIWDVKFGNHDFITTYNLSLWQIKLPISNHTVYIDNVGFNKIIVDQYKGCPFFSYQWGGAGVDAWFGPTYTGYVMPGIYHIMGQSGMALTQMTFMKDAQEEYKNRYGGAYGPFMPVHTRTRLENLSYDQMNTWTWNSPNNDTYWAGYMYRALEQVARYYYYTGNNDAKTVLDRWMNWLNTYIVEDTAFPNIPKGYLPPAEFIVNTGTWNNNYFSPDFHALIIQAMIFKYWRDGDSIAYVWYRRLLDDLIYNRKASNGSYPQWNKTYGFHQGEVGKALGMLINGRKGYIPNYNLAATNDDKQAFEQLYAYFYNNVSSQKPCAVSPEWLPLHQRENVTFGNNEKKWVINNAALSEGISICMYFAVDYATYDPSGYGERWLIKLYQFLYNAVIADKDW